MKKYCKTLVTLNLQKPITAYVHRTYDEDRPTTGYEEGTPTEYVDVVVEAAVAGEVLWEIGNFSVEVMSVTNKDGEEVAIFEEETMQRIEGALVKEFLSTI